MTPKPTLTRLAQRAYEKPVQEKIRALDLSPVVTGEARITGRASIPGEARITGKARITGRARITGKARIADRARIAGGAVAARHQAAR
jgi:UDP-3-O-[3-hydroxymyristoyl] glucosamine N-acyltransferase